MDTEEVRYLEKSLLPNLVLDKDTGHMMPATEPPVSYLDSLETDYEPFPDSNSYEENTCCKKKCPQCSIS